MNYLLDTHAFLWFIAGDNQLSLTARKHIENPNNLPFLSIGSLVENLQIISKDSAFDEYAITRVW